jgi:Flp pilus assembly protein TadD
MLTARINVMSYKKKIFLGWLVSLILLIPSVIWIFLNRQPFPGDHSSYAIDSMNLYYAMSDSLVEWLQEMRSVGYLRGPAISWVGQFFVGFGLAVGSVDTSLLFSGIVVEAITIFLLFIAVLELSNNRVSVALLAALILSAAPKFIGAPHLFNIEPLQTLAVAWFVLILAFTPKWSMALVVGQLLLAGAFSIVAKSSTPIYVVIPAAAILYSAFFSSRKSKPGGWAERDTKVSWGLGVLLLLAAVVWYLQNWVSVVNHALRSGFGPNAEVWGQADTFINTLIFWLKELESLYFRPLLIFIFLLLIFAGVKVYRKRQSLCDPVDHFTVIAIASALQVTIVLLLFAFSPNRHTRFITPLLPYVVVLTCWSVVEIRSRLINGVLLFAFVFQLVVANAYSLGLIPYGSFFTRFTDVIYGGSFSSDRTNMGILEEIVTRTCDVDDPNPQLTIVAVDPSLRGDWLAPVPVYYTAAKLFGVDHPCEFGYAGNSFWGADLEETWRDLLARDVRYFVTTDPEIYPPPADAMNQALSIDNHPRLVERIMNSGIFITLHPLESDPGILLFNLVDYVTGGRALLDRGEIDAGIELLETATDLEPENPEAWANLTLGYLLAGRHDETLEAGAQALELNPDHFYVHMMMASIYQQQGDHQTALEHFSEAVPSTPSDQDKIRALRAQAKSLLALNKVRQACFAFAEVLAIDPLPEIATEMSELDCESLISGD